jgi:hypothetical protein
LPKFIHRGMKRSGDCAIWLKRYQASKFKSHRINISGFHITPGFQGCLKFTVYNAGNKSIHLAYDAPYFLLWFADLDQPTRDPYTGPASGQSKITTTEREQMSDGRHSPDTLHHRLKKIEDQVGIMRAVGILIMVPILIGLAVALFDHWIGEENNLAIKGELFDAGALIIISLLLVGFAGAFFYWMAKHFEIRNRISKWLDDQKRG